MKYSVSGKYELANATVVNTKNGELSEGQSILIENGKIISIAPTGILNTGKEIKTIDVSGKYIVPGFLDMHLHVLENKDISDYLSLLIANGVTGFRQMAGSRKLLQKRKNQELGIKPYDSELLLMPGDLLTMVNARDPKKTAAIVRQQKADGADFIKVTFLSSEVYMAAQKEANRIGIPVAGHIPLQMDLTEASRAGIRAIEHMGQGYADQCTCSTDKTRLFEMAPGIPKAMTKIPPFLAGMTTKLVHSIIVNPQGRPTDADFDRLNRIMSTYSKELAVQSARVFAKNGTWHVPTLIRRRTSQLAYQKEIKENPELIYVPKKELQTWRNITSKYESRLTDARKKLLERNYARQLEVLKIYDEQGVKLLAGSDALGAGWMVAGFSLHHEFDELEKAGLSPLRILQMTTINGAEFLNKSDSMGTVEEGKNADLVILDANPMEGAQNLHKINSVIRAGYYYSASDILALKNSAIPK